MSGSSLLCGRRGCGHTKAEHDDPLMEGMCAHDGCECLGFVKAATAALLNPSVPTPTAVPTPEPLPDPARCEASDQGWQCRLAAHPGSNHRSWSRSGAHNWSDSPSTPGDEPVDIPDASAAAASTAPSSGPGPDPVAADAPSDHVAAIARSYADEIVEQDWEQAASEPFPQSTQELLEAEREKVNAATAEAAERIAELAAPTHALPNLREAMARGTFEPADERYVLAHEKHADGTKRCPHCEEIRPVEEFSPVKGNYDGVHGWCRPCMNARPFSPTLARTLRNRARHRASAELIQKHLAEFSTLYATYHDIVVEEAQLLADDEAAKEVYGDGPGEHVRLKPGRRQKGETVVDRIDVARCPECVKHHDAGHACEVCGAAPVHREITQSAWAGTQEKLREKMAAKKAAGE